MSGNVTILIPVYNGMPYLRDCVRSVLDQTLSDWRCVIINDGSTDGTREFLDSIRDKRFVVLHQDNAGISAAINHGLEYCDSRFVARLDADDVALPTRFAEQVAFLGAHPEVGLVGTQVAPLGDRGFGRSLRLPLEHDAIFEALLDGRHAIVHSSIMARAALVKEIGGYWSLPIGEEYDLMLRMGEVSRLANIDRVLVLWRVHQKSLTGSRMKFNRLHIEYACESARRRLAGAPPITLAAFQSQLEARPWWRQWGEAMNLHARCQYRLALAELYGGRGWLGSIRMAGAALCSPRLTAERLTRTLRSKCRPQTAKQAQSSTRCEENYDSYEKPVSTVGGSVR